MNIALVNYSSPVGWYIDGQKILVKTMKECGYNGAVYVFQDNEVLGSPSHFDNPYAFKIHAIQFALNQGHDVVWWMDSSIYPVKDISPILKIVEEKGYFFEKCGFDASMWTNDKTLKYFNITRDEAEKITLFSAGFMILDFRKKVVVDFFEQFKNSCEAGMFKGKWNNNDKTESNDERCKGHRHDLSCASIIAHKLNMVCSPCGDFLSYVGDGYGTP